jgi:predicted RNase H-like HicB family nuclease
MTSYIGIIHKDTRSDYGISFPDFPGCVSAGSDLDEVRRMGQEALAFHIEGMLADDEPVPAPSSLEEVMRHANNRSGVAVLVDAPAMPDKAIRVNVTLPERLLKRIDAVAENRSRFLARAAEREISLAAGSSARPGAARRKQAGRAARSDRHKKRRV